MPEQNNCAQMNPDDVCLLRSERIILTMASKDFINNLSRLQDKNVEFCKPWIYFSEVREYFDKVDKQERIGFFLWNSQDNSLIAVVNINNPVYGGLCSGYLGYYIDVDFANKGFMAEGLSLTLDYAFNCLGFNRLEANIQPANLPSRKLVQKLGFRLEGFSPKYLKINNQWCDHERWAILADEWRMMSKHN